MLIYSPKTVKRIKSLIKGRQSYIVPGVSPSNDDIKLSIML
jgi:IQ domain-containing protein H